MIKHDVMLPSGRHGWRARLHENYSCYEEWSDYAETYGLHIRLGFPSPETAWAENPIIEGSVEPRDFAVHNLRI